MPFRRIVGQRLLLKRGRRPFRTGQLADEALSLDLIHFDGVARRGAGRIVEEQALAVKRLVLAVDHEVHQEMGRDDRRSERRLGDHDQKKTGHTRCPKVEER